MPSGPSVPRVLAFATAVCIVCAAVVTTAAIVLRERRERNEALYEARNVLTAAGLVRPAERPDADELGARVAQLRREDNGVYVLPADDGALRKVILPIEGRGLWSTMRGFVCLDADLTTICGLTFYSHGETPGLGALIDDPKWQARWVGRRAFDDTGTIRIAVAKGPAGPPDEDPFRVDGITGATITSRGVTKALHFWLGDDGFGPYLARLEEDAR